MKYSAPYTTELDEQATKQIRLDRGERLIFKSDATVVICPENGGLAHEFLIKAGDCVIVWPLNDPTTRVTNFETREEIYC